MCVCVYVQEKKKDGNVMQERLERTFSFLSLRSQIKAFPWDVVCAAVTLRPNSIRTYFSLVAEMCFSQGRTWIHDVLLAILLHYTIVVRTAQLTIVAAAGLTGIHTTSFTSTTMNCGYYPLLVATKLQDLPHTNLNSSSLYMESYFRHISSKVSAELEKNPAA